MLAEIQVVAREGLGKVGEAYGAGKRDAAARLMDQFREESSLRLLLVLTDQQLAKWLQLLGEPLDSVVLDRISQESELLK